LVENASFDALIDKIGPVVFVVGDNKKKEGNGRKGKKSHKTLYFSHLWGRHGDTTGPNPIKFGVRVATRDEIKMSNFCNKFFRGFRCTWSQNTRFPIDFAAHPYTAAL